MKQGEGATCSANRAGHTVEVRKADLRRAQTYLWPLMSGRLRGLPMITTARLTCISAAMMYVAPGLSLMSPHLPQGTQREEVGCGWLLACNARPYTILRSLLKESDRRKARNEELISRRAPRLSSRAQLRLGDSILPTHRQVCVPDASKHLPVPNPLTSGSRRRLVIVARLAGSRPQLVRPTSRAG